MNIKGVILEQGEFGTRAVVTSAWSPQMHEQLLLLRPDELELNRSKGWLGLEVGFLVDYQWLKSLIIVDFRIEDVSHIHALKNLQNLEVLTYCKTPIHFASFPRLQKCSLEWRPKALSIFECSTLEDLFINRYSGTSSEPFGKLKKLQILGILNSPLNELHHLTQLQELRSLRLGNLSKLRSLEGIEKLVFLQKLELHTCRLVSSLSCLKDLKNLEAVYLLNGGLIDSLKPLKDLPRLNTLIFYESTNISDGDLSFIFANPKITNISFQNRRHYSHKMKDFGARSL